MNVADSFPAIVFTDEHPEVFRSRLLRIDAECRKRGAEIMAVTPPAVLRAHAANHRRTGQSAWMIGTVEDMAERIACDPRLEAAHTAHHTFPDFDLFHYSRLVQEAANRERAVTIRDALKKWAGGGYKVGCRPPCDAIMDETYDTYLSAMFNQVLRLPFELAREEYLRFAIRQNLDQLSHLIRTGEHDNAARVEAMVGVLKKWQAGIRIEEPVVMEAAR